MHAFPSDQDIDSFLEQLEETRDSGVLYYFAQVCGMIVQLVNGLRFFWFDAIYAVLVAYAMPTLLL